MESCIKLSVIIPYYKTYELTTILLDNLVSQLNSEVEVILVDDGCQEQLLDIYQINIIHLDQNRGLSYARNKGLKVAQGRFITFIDSDDDIAPNYIETILKAIKEKEFDYCLFSWKSTRGDIYNSRNLPKWNNAVWNCIYKKDKIGKFKDGYQVIEDKEFNQEFRKGKAEYIDEVLYYYYQNPNGISARFDRGEIEVEEKWHKSVS